MKKFLIGFLIGISMVGVGCSKVAVKNENIELKQQKEDEKREEFLNKVEGYVQDQINTINKKKVEDKLIFTREGNIMTYITPYTNDSTLTETNSTVPSNNQVMKNFARDTRQTAVDLLSKLYDQIVEEIGEEYEFYVRNEQEYGGEIILITKYGKDGYEFELDLFEELGY